MCYTLHSYGYSFSRYVLIQHKSFIYFGVIKLFSFRGNGQGVMTHQ